MQNPNYYNLHNVSHQHLSDHLSKLVETTLTDLTNRNVLQLASLVPLFNRLECLYFTLSEDEMDVSALNLGMITAYYNISCESQVSFLFDISHIEHRCHMYTLSLKERTKLKELLEVVSSSAEFKTIPIRRHDRCPASPYL
jgi:pre-mRNA-splicing helicase BRR2